MPNLTNWLKAIAEEHEDSLKGGVSAEACIGLQTIHTALIREIMKRSVEKQEEGDDRGKKRKFRDSVTSVMEEFGLESFWEDATALCEREQAKSSTGPKRKSKKKKMDQSLLDEQERMFQQSRDLALQKRKEE